MDKRALLEEIANRIRNCRKCELYKYRRNPVPGEGNPDAEILFIGEAPGEKEDLQGRPFVGAAGKLLNKLIESIGMRREDVFITNIVKCRPPNNRDPKKEEIEACTPYLDEQIKIIKPKIIVALGRHSAKYILSKANIKMKSIMQMRGKFFEIELFGEKITVFLTLHPAAALYNPRWRKYLEEDFEKIKEFLKGKKIKRERTLESFLSQK